MRITYNLINSFSPCYEPEEIDINAEYSATIPEFINEYRNKVKEKEDIVWTLCRNEFMSDQDLRLFGVWCARKVQYLMKDERSVKALDIAEKYANGLATDEELNAAKAAASDAAGDAAYAAYAAAYAAYAADWTAARAAAMAAASDAAWDAWDAAWDAAMDVQIDKLLEFFIAQENNLDFDWSK